MLAAREDIGLVASRLAHGDEFLGWLDGGAVVAFGWAAYRSRWVGPVPLRDAPGRVFLYNFHTLEGHRGRGLYPALLLASRQLVARGQASEFLADVNLRNKSSIRGLARGGFTPIAHIFVLEVQSRRQWVWKRTMRREAASDLW